MAIEPIRAGDFIPNKAGYPESLAEGPKSPVKQAAETSRADDPVEQQQDIEAETRPDDGRGENVNVKA